MIASSNAILMHQEDNSTECHACSIGTTTRLL